MRQLAPIGSPPREPDHRPLPELLPGVSIVMACRNDAATVAAAIRNAAAAAALISHSHEIIVVDDASSDLAADRAAVLAAADGRVQLLLHARERGYAEALRTGIAAARKPWVVLTDASLEIDLCQLEDFRTVAPDHDLLLGWRVMRRGPAAARTRAALWNRLVSRRVGIRVRDVDCPLKLVRHSLLTAMDLVGHGQMLGPELLAGARDQGARVTEVAVRQRRAATDAGNSMGPHLGAVTVADLAALSAFSRPAASPGRRWAAHHLRSSR